MTGFSHVLDSILILCIFLIQPDLDSVNALFSIMPLFAFRAFMKMMRKSSPIEWRRKYYIWSILSALTVELVLLVNLVISSIHYNPQQDGDIDDQLKDWVTSLYYGSLGFKWTMVIFSLLYSL